MSALSTREEHVSKFNEKIDTFQVSVEVIDTLPFPVSLLRIIPPSHQQPTRESHFF